MTSRREFERGGGLVVLHSTQPRVRLVFDLLHVGKALPIVYNELAALTVVAAAAAGLRVQSASKAPGVPAKAATAKAASGKTRRAAKAA
jgi:hypothetical protein